MVFNIVVIIGLVVQGLLIVWLVGQCFMLHHALAALIAYFQALINDLGYPKIIDLGEADTDELKKWVRNRKETGGEI